MKEVNSLIERAKKYLRSAKILLDEDDLESSVSRSYYAMFYSVQALLLTSDLSFSSHKGTISSFGKHYIQSGIFPREMGRELNRAFQKRQIGDYGYTFVLSRDEAEEIYVNAEIFVERITDYLNHHPNDEIRQ